MDKIEALYNSYIEQGLLSKETTLEEFGSADESIQQSLYESGIANKIISGQTDLDTFKSAWGEKKNPDETDMVSPSEDGSSVSPETDSSVSPETDFSIPISVGAGAGIGVPVNEYTKALASGSAELVAGVVGLPSTLSKGAFAMAMEAAKIVFGDKAKAFEEKVQSLPEEERTAFIQDMMPVAFVKKILKASSGGQKEITEAKEELQTIRKEYEGNIVDDLGNGDISQAASRIAVGFTESLPMMLMMIGTGGAGAATVGVSVASQKINALEKEGEATDMKTMAVGAARGLAEVAGGQVLKKMFAPVIGKVTSAEAAELAKGFWKNLASNAGAEFLEESLQTVQETLTDAIVYGREIDWNKLWKDAVDAGMIGAFSSTPAAAGGAIKGLAQGKDTQQDTPEQQAELLDGMKQQAIEDGTIPLDIPATEDIDGTPIEPTEEATLYSQELDKTKDADIEGTWTVDRITPEEASQGTVIKTRSGGGLVTKDGDIKGIFKKAGSKAHGVAIQILNKAVEAGGIKLDNFDGYLTKIYQDNGFRITSLTKFNEKKAPEGWNKEKHGTPMVVAMVYDPEGKLSIKEKTFKTYDAMIKDRDSYLAIEGKGIELNIPAEPTFEQEKQPIAEPTIEELDANVKANKEATDDTEPVAQGILPKKQRRDSSLGEGGAVGDTRRSANRIMRFVRRTFSSEQGLDQPVVRVAERHAGRLTGINKVLQADQRVFNNIIKTIKNKHGRENINKVLKSINQFLGGDKTVSLDMLSKEQIEDLTVLRKNIDEKSKELLIELRKETGKIQSEIETEMKKIQEEQVGKVEDDNALGLDTDIEFDYKSKNLKRLENRIESNKALIDTIEGNIGSYLFRQYDIFSDPEYAKAINSKTPNKENRRRFNNAVAYVMGDLNVTKAKAEKMILKYIDGIKNAENFLAARLDGKMEAPFLKKRKDIPKPIRELLGESKDPVRNYVSSFYNISTYLSSIKYQRELGNIITELGIAKTEIERGYTGFKTNNQGWDFLEGLYVPQEFADSMEDFKGLDPISQNWARWMVNAAGLTKVGKTVLSPITTSRNFLSGTLLAVNAGFVPFSNYKTTTAGFIQSWGGKKTRKGLKSENLKLLELGIIGDGAVSGEILAIMNDMKSNIERLADETVLNKVMVGMQKIYAMGDDAYKVMGFYNYKKRYMKAGHTEVEAEELAAIRIRNGFPTYSKLPKNIKWLRRFPLVGTFPSFVYEVWRTSANNLKFIASDYQKGRKENNKEYTKMAYKQAAGMVVATALASTLGVISKAILGISDEEEEAAKNMLPEWQVDSQLVFIDKGDGTLEFIDATAFLPQETIIKPLRILLEDREGRDMSEKLRLAWAAGTDAFIGTDILYNTLSQLHSNKSSYGQEIYTGKDLIEGIGNDPDKIFDYLMSNAGIGIYNNVKEFARANADNLPDSDFNLPISVGAGAGIEVPISKDIRGSVVDFFGEKESKYKEYTNTEALLALVGFRFSKMDYVAGTANLADNAKRDFQKIRIDAVRKIRAERERNLEEMNKLVNKEDDFNKEEYKSTLIAVAGHQKQGLDKVLLFKSFKAKGFTNKDIAALFAGIQPPLKQVNEASMKKAINELSLGRLRTDIEKQVVVRSSMLKNADKFNKATTQKNMENMGKWLYDNFGDNLSSEELLKNLTVDQVRLFKHVKTQGLLHEDANGDSKQRVRAIDEYMKLVKKKK